MKRWQVLVLTGLVFGGLFVGCGRKRGQKSAASGESAEAVPPPPPLAWAGLVFPTERRAWFDASAEGVFQPTASGRLESAWFGSTRTASRGGQLQASFHEGVDVAPARRDRQGRPLDDILCVATGTVAYVNAVAGNSTYGCYVVVEHEDPVGPVYTLYAHLASVAVRPGERVGAGHVLGRMGNTATYAIPLERAHLHFEVGVLLQARFAVWYDAQKLKPPHGAYHGWNLVGLDPLAFYRFQQERPAASFAAFLDATPEAFAWTIRAPRLPDYFKR